MRVRLPASGRIDCGEQNLILGTCAARGEYAILRGVRS